MAIARFPPSLLGQARDRLRRAADSSVPRRGARWRVLFSGGVDSALIAGLLRARGGVYLVTVAVRDAPELRSAEEAARALDLPWEGVPLTVHELRDAWESWGRPLRFMREPRRSVLFSLGVAFEQVEGTTAILGQGADELFGGYAHFEGLTPRQAQRRSEQDWHRLVGEDWPATLRLAEQFRVRPRAPYMDPGFADWVRGLPSTVRFGGTVRKELLRAVARHAGLPDEICDRPKRAFQYGSGIARTLRDLADRRSGPA